jgi:sugar (pentulose or hexulose) kinase
MGDWGEYLGSGVWEECDAFEHIGTTAAFYGVVDARPPAELCLEVRPHVKNGLYLAGRELLSGGMCLEWLLRKSYLSRNGVIDWALVDDEFEAIAAMHRPENVLFFARTGGRDGQLLHAAFLDLLIEDNLTSLLQGLMEGIFFELKDVAEQLAAIPWKAKDVYTTGQVGWKHSPRRTRAHIYGVPIHAGRAPGANLVSAALVGAVAGGAFEDIDEARANMLDIGGATQPDEKVRDLYAKHFERWLARRDELIRLSDD